MSATITEDRVDALRSRVEGLSATCEQLEDERDRALREIDETADQALRDRMRAEERVAAARVERDAARAERDRLRKQMRAQASVPKAAKATVEVTVPRLAMNKTDAAAALGVSVDFFDAHIAAELKCVRRGRRRLYPTTELQRWLDAEAERAVYPGTGLR